MELSGKLSFLIYFMKWLLANKKKMSQYQALNKAQTGKYSWLMQLII